MSPPPSDEPPRRGAQLSIAPPIGRRRFRDLGLQFGRYPTGPWNAITDVAGVRVGHTTLVEGEGRDAAGRGPVRSGVTAIIPGGNVFLERLIAGAFVLNGAGELTGIHQIQEWGLLETPILLTNTMSVGKVSDALIKWITRRVPGIGDQLDVLIPVVGECDDSYLNDAAGRNIRSEHVYRALESAASGPVAEGSVGAGTGMVTCDFKAGIGTASRRVPAPDGQSYTVGILVETNFGVMHNLRVDGVPVGQLLEPSYQEVARREHNYGSIIVVVATDAPLLAQQITRLCKRAALGVGRAGSYAGHGSGEIIIGFSTANRLPRPPVASQQNPAVPGPSSPQSPPTSPPQSPPTSMVHRIDVLLDSASDPLYEAVIEATEEAIVNALCAADSMRGRDDHFAPGLPLDRLIEIMRKYRP